MLKYLTKSLVIVVLMLLNKSIVRVIVCLFRLCGIKFSKLFWFIRISPLFQQQKTSCSLKFLRCTCKDSLQSNWARVLFSWKKNGFTLKQYILFSSEYKKTSKLLTTLKVSVYSIIFIWFYTIYRRIINKFIPILYM